MITYLKHSDIDKAKWDDCIDKSINRLVYATSWYLDMVSPDWEALVTTDYQMVMPLPVKRKFFLEYLVQPVFTQQLGVYSALKISPDRVTDFLNHIPRKFFRQILNMNTANVITYDTRLTNRVNFELDLNRSYSLIYDDYNENTQRNIRKAITNGVLVEPSNDIILFIDFYKKNAKEKPNQFVLEKLWKILTHSIENQKGELVFAVDKGGRVVSGAFFLMDLGRIIYLISFSTPEGQENSAMFLLMDEMIKKHAKNPFIFDFEGSMIPGVARFFAGFGPELKVYQQYRKGW